VYPFLTFSQHKWYTLITILEDKDSVRKWGEACSHILTLRRVFAPSLLAGQEVTFETILESSCFGHCGLPISNLRIDSQRQSLILRMHAVNPSYRTEIYQRSSDWQFSHLKGNMHDLNFWLEGCKTGATPSLSFNQLWASWGVDFSGILDRKDFRISERAFSRRLFTQPSSSSDVALGLLSKYFRVNRCPKHK
jgi:hypothetical protein